MRFLSAGGLAIALAVAMLLSGLPSKSALAQDCAAGNTVQCANDISTAQLSADTAQTSADEANNKADANSNSINSNAASISSNANSIAGLQNENQQQQQQINENTEGVAMALALKMPDFVADENFGIRLGYGNFEGSNALGLSVAGVLGRDIVGPGSRLTIHGGIGRGLSEKTVGISAGGQLTW